MQQIYDAMEHNFGAELGAGCYDGPFVKFKYRFCRTCSSSYGKRSVSSEDSMESIINAVVQKDSCRKKDLT